MRPTYELYIFQRRHIITIRIIYREMGVFFLNGLKNLNNIKSRLCFLRFREIKYQIDGTGVFTHECFYGA